MTLKTIKDVNKLIEQKLTSPRRRPDLVEKLRQSVRKVR